MPQDEHDRVDHPLERLMFFSDAVFAIAITLLVVEIRVPELKDNLMSTGLDALFRLIPSFFAYVLSFLVIAVFWMSHHAQLGVMARHVPRLVWPNTFLLMGVAFMPFATAFYARNQMSAVANVFYDLALLWLAIGNTWMGRIATAPENARESFKREDRLRAKGAAHGVIAGAAIAAVLSIFIAPASQASLWLIVPAQLLLGRLYVRKFAKE